MLFTHGTIAPVASVFGIADKRHVVRPTSAAWSALVAALARLADLAFRRGVSRVHLRAVSGAAGQSAVQLAGGNAHN